MTLAIDARKGNTMAMVVPKDEIEIVNFRNYVLKIEGQELRSKNSQDKKLMVKVGRDGVVHIELVSSGQKPVEDLSFIDASVPNGYKRVFRTESAKTIRGVKGKYLYYKNNESDYIAYAYGPSGKSYRIHVGKIVDRNSKFRVVYEHLPSKPFVKAYFNDILPSSIVENRQPIKAALDVLEKEGYVKKTGNVVGISEEYIKTAKAAPAAPLQSVLDGGRQ